MNDGRFLRRTCYGLTAGLLVVVCGCAEAPSASPTLPKTPVSQPPVSQPAKRVQATPTATKVKAKNPLDADRAMSYLEKVCAIGPRPAGSAGMTRQQALLTKHFEALGGKVSLQQFEMPHPLSDQRLRCANLIVQWHPEAKERVLLCAHYDTRPLPDRDPNPSRRRNGIFIGANDGASGVAMLMELGHHLPATDLKVGVDMVLFDAEEMVYLNSFGQDQGDYFWGSSYFASQYRQKPPAYRYRWGVLVDMVGDANLELLQERYSLLYARKLVLDLWRTADRLGVKEFKPRTKRRLGGVLEVRDDHLPLNQLARIPSCDIIDADYPNVPFGHQNSYWHTEQDLPKHCSGESLAKVGWVILEWLKTQPETQD